MTPFDAVVLIAVFLLSLALLEPLGRALFESAARREARRRADVGRRRP